MRGRSLPSPKAPDVRPTGAKMRQAIFNILSNRIAGASFLDLFAGTGIMGLEAISRGASNLTAVEENRKLLKELELTLEKFSIEAELIWGDVRKVLGQLDNRAFDIIFADPPYRSTLAKSVTHLVSRNGLLKPNGIMIIEHASTLDLEPELKDLNLSLADRRSYGQSSISLLVPSPERQGVTG